MQAATVPLWFQAAVVVLSAMCSAALAFTDPAVTFLTPTVKFILFVVNVGLTALAAVLSIRKPNGT